VNVVVDAKIAALFTTVLTSRVDRVSVMVRIRVSVKLSGRITTTLNDRSVG